MEILQYNERNAKTWNRFITKSKNANFQHFRPYMEYHQERFEDNSLLFIENGNAKSLLPANKRGKTIYSHEGLTHGGILLSSHVKQREVLKVLEALMIYGVTQKLESLVIKIQPHIYNNYPSEEVHYALYKNNATLSGRAVSSIIALKDSLPYSKGRKWSLKKSLLHNVSITETTDFEKFMEIEKVLLKEKYNSQPVHTSLEIQFLQKSFPENIKMFSVNYLNEMIGGVILFLMGPVVKCQYICSTDLCRKLHGLDVLFDELIKKYAPAYSYFDFGHSTLDGGKYLEDTLIQNKESYGARAICYDTYTLKF